MSWVSLMWRPQWDAIVATVEAMEAGTWDSAWFPDHFIPPYCKREDEAEPAFEGLTSLAVIAGMTKRLRLGNLVLGNTFRNPAHVAKIAGTIDAASNGRFTLALGTGAYGREHRACGWSFPEVKERCDRLEEAVELIRRLFHSEEPVSFDGTYYKTDRARLSPRCVDRPIPILIGGTCPKRTLRTLARYGDVMNLDGWSGGGLELDYYKSKVEILERHCEDARRDPAEIRRTILAPCFIADDKSAVEQLVGMFGPGTLAGPRQYIVDRLGEFSEAGVDEVMFGGINPGDLEKLQQFEAEIVSAFR